MKKLKRLKVILQLKEDIKKAEFNSAFLINKPFI